MWPSCGPGLASPALRYVMTQVTRHAACENVEHRATAVCEEKYQTYGTPRFVKTGTKRTEHCGSRNCSPPVPVPRGRILSILPTLFRREKLYYHSHIYSDVLVPVF